MSLRKPTLAIALAAAGLGVFASAQEPPKPAIPVGNPPQPPAAEGPQTTPALLLADTAQVPTVTVSWPTRSGNTLKLTGPRPYKSQGDKAALGRNIEAFVALGGTRVERGLGNPKGATIRCGLYKADATKPFFDDLADDATVMVTISGVKMNQPAIPVANTALMHLKYSLGDLARCGIDSTGRNLFVTQAIDDPIAATVLDGSGKFGYLDGAEGHGKVKAKVEPDGTMTIGFTFPYHLLRHTKDPYQRTNPGGFFEPWHFHVEIEVIPAAPAAEEESKP